MNPSAQPAAGWLPISVTEPVASIFEPWKSAWPPMTVGRKTLGKAPNAMWEDPGLNVAAIKYYLVCANFSQVRFAAFFQLPSGNRLNVSTIGAAMSAEGSKDSMEKLIEAASNTPRIYVNALLTPM